MKNRKTNLVLALLLACFIYNGQKLCPGGGVDTGNPKGIPGNDPNKPITPEDFLRKMRQQPNPSMENGYRQIRSQASGNPEQVARGGEEIGPKIIKA